jgi:hypothetical protein
MAGSPGGAWAQEKRVASMAAEICSEPTTLGVQKYAVLNHGCRRVHLDYYPVLSQEVFKVQLTRLTIKPTNLEV